MENNKSIVDQLSLVIQQESSKLKKDDVHSALERANDLYNDLVKQGVIKKRGYTLKGAEDNHLFQMPLNNFINQKI